MAVIGTWNPENLYRPGGEFGPRDADTYRAKLSALADTIDREAPDVLAVQGVGEPEALADLVALLDGEWSSVLSAFTDDRGIRVGFLSRTPPEVLEAVAAFPEGLAPVQAREAGQTTARIGRSALAVRLELPVGPTVDLVTCHLKSKLLTFPPRPGGSGTVRFSTRDEGERARFGAYAIYLRAAEAVTVRALADRLLGGEGRERAVVLLTRPRGPAILPRLPRPRRADRPHPGQPRAARRHAGGAHRRGRPLPSIEDDPSSRRATGHASDHALVLARLVT